MDKEEYREAIRTLQEAVKEVGPNNRDWKRWSRQAASHSARELPFDEERPERISRDGALRATLLCMILAGSRGRLHCRCTGRGTDRQEMTLALQREVIENAIESEAKYERNFGKYIKDGTWPPPDLRAHERALAKELFDETDRRRSSGPVQGDGDRAGSAEGVPEQAG